MQSPQRRPMLHPSPQDTPPPRPPPTRRSRWPPRSSPHAAGRRSIWRPSDYVIDASNSDKPYDLCIKEQIAGDELEPGNEQALIATGFMANYTDNPTSRDLIQRKYQITTDIVDTIGQGVLAT